MKKITISMLLMVSSYVLYAQETMDSTVSGKVKTKIKTKPDKDMNDMEGNGKMKIKVKGNPNETNTNFSKDGMMNSRTNTTTTTTTVVSIPSPWANQPASLPVLINAVPSAVVLNIKNKYGDSVYDIKKIKGNSSGMDVYVVRIMDNGQYKTTYLNEDGNAITQ